MIAVYRSLDHDSLPGQTVHEMDTIIHSREFTTVQTKHRELGVVVETGVKKMKLRSSSALLKAALSLVV